MGSGWPRPGERLLTGRPFLVLVADESLSPDPRGVRAFSYDDDNAHLPHPLGAGSLIWTRDLGEPSGTERLARIAAVEQEGWPVGYFVYYLADFDPHTPVALLAQALGCTPGYLLGVGDGQGTS